MTKRMRITAKQAQALYTLLAQARDNEMDMAWYDRSNDLLDAIEHATETYVPQPKRARQPKAKTQPTLQAVELPTGLQITAGSIQKRGRNG